MFINSPDNFKCCKYTLTVLVALISIAFGCAKENVGQAKPVQVKLKGGGECLTTYGENIAKYQKGELSNGEVEVFWSCVQGAVADYQRLTSGDAAGGAYTPQALRRFMQKYFIKSQNIGNPLLNSLMEIKRVLLGGTSREISSDELTALQDFLQMLKEISVEMNPYVRVIFMHNDSADDGEIRRAGAVVDQSLNRLGHWLDRKNQDYSFAQMRELIQNLLDFRKGDSRSSDLFKTLNQAMDVLPPAKLILLNGARDGMRGTEWQGLAASLGQGYRALLGVQYAFKDDLNTALIREAIPSGMEHAVAILERAAKKHGKNEIPLAEWREFFTQLEKTKWMSDAFTADNIMFAFKWVLNRTLQKGLGNPASALTAAHLGSLRTILADWQMLRKAVLGLGPYRGPVGERFKNAIAAGQPQEWDAQGRMYFALNSIQAWTTDGTLHMVWPFVVMNWLKDAFVPGGEPEVGDQIMEMAGLEILTTMRKFGWLTHTKDTIGKKLLREGDLFTLASNGNGTIDIFEATRYLAFIASSYRAAQLWLKDAEGVCGNHEAECIRRLGADLNRDILGGLPRLQNWLRRRDGVPRFVTYFKASEETVLEKIIIGEFETADLLQVYMLFQYIETFLQRYDGNMTDTISLAEATPAFDVYGPILGKMLIHVGLPADELFGFFTFLMKYGDTFFTMFGGQVLYNHWKWHPNDWAFESDRNILMGILNQLSKL